MSLCGLLHIRAARQHLFLPDSCYSMIGQLVINNLGGDPELVGDFLRLVPRHSWCFNFFPERGGRCKKLCGECTVSFLLHGIHIRN